MTCAMPVDQTEAMKEKRHRRLDEALVTHEEAELACERADIENFDQCVFDGKIFLLPFFWIEKKRLANSILTISFYYFFLHLSWL